MKTIENKNQLMYQNKINLVFTRMFDFLISPKQASMQGLFHSYRFILYFFGQIYMFSFTKTK
jgi:hypothetical protein